MKPIFSLLFQRLTSSKTTKFVKSLLVFFGVYICKLGAVNFIQLIDSIQANMFGMVVDRLLIAETQKVTGVKEKKFVAVGLTKLLCEAPETVNGAYAKYWYVISYQHQLLFCKLSALAQDTSYNIFSLSFVIGHRFSKL